jgi:hypothetical protein
MFRRNLLPPSSGQKSRPSGIMVRATQSEPMRNICPYALLRATSSPSLAHIPIPAFLLYISHIIFPLNLFFYLEDGDSRFLRKVGNRESAFTRPPSPESGSTSPSYIKLGEEYELRSFSSCSNPQFFITSPHSR